MTPNKFFRFLCILGLVICGLCALDCRPIEATVLDSYLEDFDNRQQDATIDGVDYWKVVQGLADNAIVQNYVTFPGGSQSLKIAGALPNTIVGRATSYYPDLKPMPILYGGLTPTWVRFRALPSYAGQTPTLPAHGIAAVTFDYTGKVLVSNGTATGPVWVDTGMTYTIGRWYDVTIKLDFWNYIYDFYIFDALVPSSSFTPIISGLNFIDYQVGDYQKNTLSAFKFSGAYSTSLSDDVYIDYVSVDYIYRLEIITPPQKLLRGQESGLITMQLQNKLSEPQTSVKPITLDLKSTSWEGRFSLSREPWVDVTQIVMPRLSQDISFYYKDNKAGKPIINVAEYPDQGYIDALVQFEILSQPEYFDVEVGANQTAGEEFEVKIIAKDKEGQINENYGGTVLLSIDYVSPMSGTYEISPTEVSGFIEGVAEAIVSYPDCGTVTITATDQDEPESIGKSVQIVFAPADFIIEAEEEQVVARPFMISATARNAAGVITPNYNGTVNLYPLPVVPAAVSGASFTPAVIAGPQFEDGKAMLHVAYNRYGVIKIKGSDSLDETKYGVSNEVQFLPKGISLGVELPEGKEFFYIGEPIGIILKVIDDAGNAVVNYPGTVSLFSSAGFSIVPDYTFTAEDAGEHIIVATATKAGTYSVKASAEEGALSGESALITVKEAYIEVIDTTSPIGTGEVVVQIVDENGNVITSENDLQINLTVEEESENNSAYLPSGPVTLKQGRAIISISDTEAEIVTIIPSSLYKIKIKKGTVTFGQIGKSGISTQMWRELKEK